MIRGDVAVAVDVSSSAIRALNYDERFAKGVEFGADITATVDRSGRATQSFSHIVREYCAVVPQAASTARGAIAALVACGTASSFAWANRDRMTDPSAVSDCLLWSDTRGREEWLTLLPEVKASFDRTLCPAHLSYWPNRLRWVQRQAAADSNVVFGGAKDFLFAWLTGHFWTDPMTAGATGVFDSESWRWDEALLDRVGVSAKQLPAVREACESAPLRPAAAAELGLPPGLPVVVGGMDGPLSHLGSAGLTAGVASCTIGTSPAFRALATHRKVDAQQRVWCYPVDSEKWVVGGAGNNGGNIMNWLRNQFGDPTSSVAQLLDQAFARDFDPHLQFVPYLNGERAPLWRPELRAAFVGLAAHHTRGDLTHAALRGVTAAMIELAAAVAAAAGEQRQARLTGGFTQDHRWTQLMTDALGIPTATPVPDTATATGTAMLAWSSVKSVPLATVFTPAQATATNPDPEVHQLLLDESERLRSLRTSLWPTPHHISSRQ